MNSQALNELFTALSKAQGEMSHASKDCTNPHYKSKYADLNSVWAACREPLSKNGLTVIQTVIQADGGDVLVTMLGHSSGQYISSTMPIRIKSGGSNELQALGSCLSYLRRYALMGIVGIAPGEDDDGNSATGYKATPTPPAIPVITLDQNNHLEKLLQMCGNEFATKIVDWLKIKGVESLSKVPTSMYESLRKRLEDEATSREVESDNE